MQKFCIGESVLGRKIWAYRIGKGDKKILLTAGIHAREYVTCEIVKLFLCQDFDFQIVCVPYSNIDGTLLCKYGLDSVANEKKKKFLQYINKSEDFSQFKANANGVDLNVNFPARFGLSKSNKDFPASSDYIGKYPLCEPENIAIATLCEKENFAGAICFHSKGEEIYWKFYQQKYAKRDKNIGKLLANSCGYKLKNYVSSGGLKDYLIERYKISAYTIEVGNEKLSHPINDSFAPYFFERLKFLPQILADNIT